MVKVAVVGGTGNVATQLLRAPLQSGNHEITIFSRSSPPTTRTPGVSYLQVDYHNLEALTEALRGFHTCLSFVVAHLDIDNVAQKNLIHACIAAGVRRFAPSEWSIASKSGVPEYANKDAIAAYLADLKEQGKLGGLEYCLFQPSVFIDYFAHPYSLAPGLATWPYFIDFEGRRAIVLDDGEQKFSITTAADDSAILERALSDPNPWQVAGGFHGDTVSMNEMLALGKRLRPGKWHCEYVKSEDIEKDELKTSFVPLLSHPSLSPDQAESFSKHFVITFFRAIKKGAWLTGDALNQRYPDFKFTSVEQYVTKAFEGKP